MVKCCNSNARSNIQHLEFMFVEAPHSDVKIKCSLLVIVYVIHHNTFHYIALNGTQILVSSTYCPKLPPPLLYSTFRSFNNSAMSICGLLLAPVLLEHSALCRLLAAWFRDGRMRAASGVSSSPREHRRTSLTSPSIFLERMVGNNELTCSNTLFLKTESRHTRFSMNTPVPGEIEETGDRILCT